MQLRPPARLRAARAALCAATAALILAAPAGAATVSIDLNYTCNFPLMKPQPLALHITSDTIPSEVNVGKQTGAFAITATAKVNAFAANGLRAVDATTIEGSAVATTDVIQPNGSIFSAKVPTTLTKRDIPAEAFDTTAAGATPSLLFRDTGTVKLNIKDLVLTLTPRLADGTPTGLDTFETECFQDAGQNNTLATIKVVDPNAGPTATDWGLTGQIGLKTLAQGIVPLTGTATTSVDKTSGAATGQVTLNPAHGSLQAVRLLPIKADFVFTPSGTASGSLVSNKLSLTTKQDIRLTNVAVFGINLVSGVCHTATPATIALASSAGGFDPASGGIARSVFTIPSFTGCGLLTNLVSGLAAGGGNAIALTFTPNAA